MDAVTTFDEAIGWSKVELFEARHAIVTMANPRWRRWKFWQPKEVTVHIDLRNSVMSSTGYDKEAGPDGKEEPRIVPPLRSGVERAPEWTAQSATVQRNVGHVPRVRDAVLEKIARRICARQFGCRPDDGYVNIHWIDFRPAAEAALEVINEVGP